MWGVGVGCVHARVWYICLCLLPSFASRHISFWHFLVRRGTLFLSRTPFLCCCFLETGPGKTIPGFRRVVRVLAHNEASGDVQLWHLRLRL